MIQIRQQLFLAMHPDGTCTIGMCGIDIFYFGSVSVRFVKKRFGSEWVWFSSVQKMRFGSNSYLLLT